MEKPKYINNEKIIINTLKNGKWEQTEINNNHNRNNIKEDIIDDSNDIIHNDEFVGEFSHKKIQNQNDNIIEINDGTENSKNNNNNYNIHIGNKINRINKTPNKKFEYGNVIEERRNYKLYVSGVGYVDNNSPEKIPNNICIERYIKNSPSCESYRYFSEQDNNICDYTINSRAVMNSKNYFNTCNSSQRNSPKYICYSSPPKREYKTPYNLKPKGIIRDNLDGQFFRVFQAIPADIDADNCGCLYTEIYNNKNQYYSPHKLYHNNIKCYRRNNNNFFFNSNLSKSRSQKRFIVNKPLIKHERNNSSNLYQIKTNDKTYQPQSEENFKSFCYKKNPIYKKNNIITKSNKNNDNKIEYFSKKIQVKKASKLSNNYNNNNNVIEINENNNKS